MKFFLSLSFSLLFIASASSIEVWPYAYNQEQQSALAETTPDETRNNTIMVGDPVQGKRVFRKCKSCHSLKPGKNRVGPSLYAIVGAQAGRDENFRYSSANRNANIIWTQEALSAFIEYPQGYLPGTRMIFSGLSKSQDRLDVIAYLEAVANTDNE